MLMGMYVRTTHVHMYVRTHTYIHTNTYIAYICTHTHIQTHIRMHNSMHECHAQCVGFKIPIHTEGHIGDMKRTSRVQPASILQGCANYESVYACTHTYAHKYTCIDGYMDTYMPT
jgi:hypothetical protein